MEMPPCQSWLHIQLILSPDEAKGKDCLETMFLMEAVLLPRSRSWVQIHYLAIWQETFCVVFGCTSYICLSYSKFLPQSKDMHLTGLG